MTLISRSPITKYRATVLGTVVGGGAIVEVTLVVLVAGIVEGGAVVVGIVVVVVVVVEVVVAVRPFGISPSIDRTSESRGTPQAASVDTIVTEPASIASLCPTRTRKTGANLIAPPRPAT
jgi:predicted metalloprotease